jgi:hypothetical protein
MSTRRVGGYFTSVADEQTPLIPIGHSPTGYRFGTILQEAARPQLRPALRRGSNSGWTA